MRDFLYFDKMITPKLILPIYWFLLLGAITSGWFFFELEFKVEPILLSVLLAVVGAVVVRVTCELFIVMFKINEALQEIKGK